MRFSIEAVQQQVFLLISANLRRLRKSYSERRSIVCMFDYKNKNYVCLQEQELRLVMFVVKLLNQCVRLRIKRRRARPSRT